LPGAVQPGRDRPQPEPPPVSDYNFSIEAPHRSSVPRAVDEIHFKLNDVKIVGAVTIPADTFRPLYQNLLGKDVTLANIYDVADGIERAYRAAGYPLVRAFVPPQRVKDGIFTIRIVEGYVSSVSVEGVDPKVQERIKAYLRNVEGEKPLKLATVERGLLLSNDLPGATATGVLRPAPDAAGASDLVVSAAQPKFQGGIAGDNRGSRFSGIWTVSGDLEANSLIAGGDQLMGDVVASPNSLEQIGGDLRYRAPIGDDGMMGSLIGRYTHGEPGSTLHAFGVLTDSFAFGPRIYYPFIRSRETTLTMDAGFTVQDATVQAGTPVATLSHDRWRVIDATISYLKGDLFRGSFGISANVSQGLPIFGASKTAVGLHSRDGGDFEFTKISFGARYQRPLFGNFSFALSSQGQFSGNRLISGEQIAFGGSQIGRGYDPGAITGDNGIGGSAELRYNWNLAKPPLLSLQPFVFFDAAATWYNNSASSPFFDPSLTSDNIASVGAGVRAALDHGITIGLEVDRTLHAVPGSDNNHEATKLLVDAAIRF
jgi:hemolysin activation/secretion protein